MGISLQSYVFFKTFTKEKFGSRENGGRKATVPGFAPQDGPGPSRDTSRLRRGIPLYLLHFLKNANLFTICEIANLPS